MGPSDRPEAFEASSEASSRETATLFLDRELRVLRFSPKVGEFFNMRMTDRGRSVSHLARRLGYDELQRDAEQVLREKVPVEREVQDETGRWFLTRVLPFRPAEDRVEGIVLTFHDITWRKQSETRRRELASRITMAEEAERRRISRILHDDLQQLLYGASMQLSIAARQLLDDGVSEASQAVTQTQVWIAQALAITRSLSVDLNPPALEGKGLADSLRWLQRVMKELHGLEVVVEAEQKILAPDPDMSQLLFQSTRELLFNVRKHAGVNRATVRLAQEAGDLVIHVIDEGGGFDLEEQKIQDDSRGCSGLSSLRERLTLVGGRLEIRSSPGGGTHVEVHVPIMSA